MISLTIRAAAHPGRNVRLRSWQTAAGLTSVAAGAAVITGALLPWVETFGGLIGIPGVRGSNGRVLAAAGAVIAGAGIYHLLRGSAAARWLAGLAGFAAVGFSGYLLVQLARSMSVLGGDSMVVARGGPGLWVAAAGSAVAFSTLLFPSSAQVTLRRTGSRGTSWAWAADRESVGARRGLQLALGTVWLLDAALQYQPYMFGKGFVSSVLAPASMGNPALLADPASWATQIIAHDVVAWNAAFATIQLALAAGLLWRRTAWAALYGTIGWALAVWLLAEGAGGVVSGMAAMTNPLTGAPGAAVLYALLALLILPARSRGEVRSGIRSVADGSLLGLRWAQASWAVLWISFAYFILQPMPTTRLAFIGAALGPHAGLVAIALAVAFVLTGAGIACRRTARPALVLAVILALFIWVAGEDFGGILTGHATDPNTGPLLVLLATAFWPLGSRRATAPDRARSLIQRGAGTGPGLHQVTPSARSASTPDRQPSSWKPQPW